ncbi:hypothetical protein GO117_03025 [Campylobacter fetus]|nr:hypothetical protein [Campylobacter fetus]EJU9540110.1 nucleotidyl transferase AbiEii/AbiGii toxin family protein [Campylobacter fetus]
MKIQTQILPKEQLELYPYLRSITNLGFTLYGGTAIALQLGHRQSIDFDFFTDKDISNLHDKLLNLDGIIVSKITQQQNNTLTFKTINNVKFSFFGGLEFVKLSTKIDSDDNVLKLADLGSLLTTKLKATCDRAEYKDYIDIVKILKTNKVSLEVGLKNIKEYFGGDFPLIQIVKGLTYFEDGDLYKLTNEDKNFLIDATNKIDILKIVDFNKTNNKDNKEIMR